MATSSERKKGIAGRRRATRRRVNLTRRATTGKPPARAPRNSERRIGGLTLAEITWLMTHDDRAFDQYYSMLSPAKQLEVMDMVISGELDQ